VGYQLFDQESKEVFPLAGNLYPGNHKRLFEFVYGSIQGYLFGDYFEYQNEKKIFIWQI